MARGMRWDTADRRERLRRDPPDVSAFRRVTVPQRRLIRELERELGLPAMDLMGVGEAQASLQIDRLLKLKRELSS